MAFDEKWESRPKKIARDASGTQCTLIFVLTGHGNDDIAAKTELLANVPATYDGLYFHEVSSFERTGNDVWEAACLYKNQEPDACVISFDTSGGTQHVTQSLETISRTAFAGKTAPNFNGAVGVTHDDVEGCDIRIRGLQFSITETYDISWLTFARVQLLYLMTTTVNDRLWKGFARGECQFLGAQGSGKLTDKLEVTFNFLGSPNITFSYEDSTTGAHNIAKEGHHYIWCRYEDDDDDMAKARIKSPVAVYVERFYEYTNFNNLGITCGDS